MVTLEKDDKTYTYTTLKKAVSINNWGNYRTIWKKWSKGGRKDIEGYKVTLGVPAPKTNLSIECFDLLDYLKGDFEFDGTINKEEAGCQEIILWHDFYMIMMEINITITKSGIATDAIGHDLEDVDTIIVINEIWSISDASGNDFELDEYTEQQLIKKLENTF